MHPFCFSKKIDQPERWIAFDVTPKEIDPVLHYSTVISVTRKLEQIAERIDEAKIRDLLKARNPALTVDYLYTLI